MLHLIIAAGYREWVLMCVLTVYNWGQLNLWGWAASYGVPIDHIHNVGHLDH